MQVCDIQVKRAGLDQLTAYRRIVREAYGDEESGSVEGHEILLVISGDY